MRTSLLLLIVAAQMAACGGSSPTAPSAPPVVVVPPVAPPPVVIANIQSSPCPATVIGFDIGFYHEFGCDTVDRPGSLQPLRRWMRAPSIYLRTVDDAGASIDAKTLDSTEQAIVQTLPLWSGYAAAVTRGTDSRVGQSGWVTVEWRADASQPICGLSDEAADGGRLGLYYRRGGGCKCPGGPEITPRTVKHELGHAMGFYHTDSAADIMAPGVPGCDASPSPRELQAAAFHYR